VECVYDDLENIIGCDVHGRRFEREVIFEHLSD
jgi:hypothetical protein